MNPFRKSRCIELSILDSLESSIESNWSGVSVVKAFAQAYKESLPVVSIRLGNENDERQEIGTNTLRRTFTMIIDIFCTSDGQRLDLADFITETIKNGFVYYEFSHASGNLEELEKTENGRITLEFILNNSRVEFGDSPSLHDKFRHNITFTVRH
jgi:hypothetical protein